MWLVDNEKHHGYASSFRLVWRYKYLGDLYQERTTF